MSMTNVLHLIMAIALAAVIGPVSMRADTTSTPSTESDQRRKNDTLCFAVSEAGVRKSEVFMSVLVNFRDMRAAIKRHYRGDEDFFEGTRSAYAVVVEALDKIEADGGTKEDQSIAALYFTNICLEHHDSTYGIN